MLTDFQFCESRRLSSVVVRRGSSRRNTICVSNELLDKIDPQRELRLHETARSTQKPSGPDASLLGRDKTRPAVRSAFAKASQCRTLELGAEVFASGNEEQVFYHTCKSRPCSSCGYRATVQWQRERWAALPDVPYKGITFTMPDVLWPLFGDNPHLTTALSALAA